MTIFGISAYHHDSAAALLQNGFVRRASHEERFTRKKFDNSFPSNSIRWMRHHIEKVDGVAYYERPGLLERQNIKREIKKAIPGKYPIEFMDHHKCHAMSSILTTDWDRCAVLVVDSVGGNYSTSLGMYENNEITWIKRFEYPESLGLFYSTITNLLGFVPLSDECKIMSAAAYGEPKWKNYMKEKFLETEFGNYTLKQDLRRGVGKGVLDWDIAASAQELLQDCLINLANWLFKETACNRLAYAGGVALNCVANTNLIRYSNFDHIAIQPAAGDAGCALGAAGLLDRPIWENAYLGYEDSLNQNPEDIAQRLLRGEIVPVINGPAEFGPRALGNRSLLALPTPLCVSKLDNLKGRVNDSWRPYAPVCLEEVAEEYFDIYYPSYEMLYVAYNEPNSPFKTHDETARLQLVNKTKNAFLAKILDFTTKLGHPILINTSLNAKGKPIVNTVEHFKNEIKL